MSHRVTTLRVTEARGADYTKRQLTTEELITIDVRMSHGSQGWVHDDETAEPGATFAAGHF